MTTITNPMKSITIASRPKVAFPTITLSSNDVKEVQDGFNQLFSTYYKTFGDYSIGPARRVYRDEKLSATADAFQTFMKCAGTITLYEIECSSLSTLWDAIAHAIAHGDNRTVQSIMAPKI